MRAATSSIPELFRSGRARSLRARIRVCEGDRRISAEDYAGALECYERAIEERAAAEGTFLHYNAACAAARLGEKSEDHDARDRLFTKAIEWLRVELKLHATGKTQLAQFLAQLRADPDLAILRGTPTLDALLEEVSAAAEADAKSSEPVGVGK